MTNSASKASLTERAWEVAQCGALVCFWYSINVGLVVSNKWLISETGFRSSTVLALLHMITSAACSSILVLIGLVPGKELNRSLAMKVFVLAASFTVSVSTCMASLKYLPASFVQAVGSTTPGFTAGLALLIQGRLEARPTYAALLPVAGGIALVSGGEPAFSALGLALQLCACASRSLKTVLQAVLLTDDHERFHTLTLLAYTSAASAAMLVPLAVLTERDALRLAAQLRAQHDSFAPLLGLSCALAFLANWTNFMVSKRLGALTLQVLGNFRNVVVAVVTLLVFRDPITRMAVFGYAITTLGVFIYTHLVFRYPAVWIPPPIARLLGGWWGSYRPVEQPEVALPPAAPAPEGKGVGGGGRGVKGGGGSGGDGKMGGVDAGEHAPLLLGRTQGGDV